MEDELIRSSWKSKGKEVVGVVEFRQLESLVVDSKGNEVGHGARQDVGLVEPSEAFATLAMISRQR